MFTNKYKWKYEEILFNEKTHHSDQKQGNIFCKIRPKKNSSWIQQVWPEGRSWVNWDRGDSEHGRYWVNWDRGDSECGRSWVNWDQGDSEHGRSKVN